MRKHRTIWAVWWACTLLLGLAPPASAAITCGDTTTSPFATDETPDLSVTVTAQTNRITFLGIHDRSESVTIDSVSDTGSGTWTLISGPDSSALSTMRQWAYYRTGGSTGAVTVTVDFSAAVNSTVSATTCYSDAAALSYVSAAAVVDNASGTAHVSNTRTFTTTGVVLGFMATNNNSSISAVGSNQANLTAATSRGHLVRRFESSGTQGLDVTTAASTNSLFSAALFQEDAASTPCRGGLLLMEVGGCE